MHILVKTATEGGSIHGFLGDCSCFLFVMFTFGLISQSGCPIVIPIVDLVPNISFFIPVRLAWLDSIMGDFSLSLSFSSSISNYIYIYI